MCKRNCYYRSGIKVGSGAMYGQRICNYCVMTGRTRTAELVDAYKKKGRILTDKERKRILTDEENCPWFMPPSAQGRRAVLPNFFNSRITVQEMRCEACGKTFIGGPRAKYCPDCKLIMNRKRQAEWRSRKLELTCLDCGETFIGQYQAKYCPDCRHKRWSEGRKK
ncbi:MAG: hypothetical protein K6E83_06575 [Clostridium sp.]|nr:hypothetical protein [Clostridium sp.]